MVSLNRDALTEKILEGARISTDDALELYRSPLEELAALANARRDLAKAKSYGGRGREIVTYIVDRNINYTNVCNVYCKFCAFYRTERDEDHYVLSFEQLDQSGRCRFRCSTEHDHAGAELAEYEAHLRLSTPVCRSSVSSVPDPWREHADARIGVVTEVEAGSPHSLGLSPRSARHAPFGDKLNARQLGSEANSVSL